jgi:hypothetical protein
MFHATVSELPLPEFIFPQVIPARGQQLLPVVYFFNYSRLYQIRALSSIFEFGAGGKIDLTEISGKPEFIKQWCGL